MSCPPLLCVTVLTWSPADSPYLSTPISSVFHPDPNVVGGNENDVDPFKTLEEVEGAGKISGVVVSPSLKRDSEHADLQESPSPPNNAEGTACPSQRGADVVGLGKPANHLEKPFTRGASLFFHDPPRQYTLVRRVDSGSDNGASGAMFVIRSSPQIIEEDCLEFEPKGQNDNESTPYSFPCEDPKIDELVAKMASLCLGTGLPIARSIVTLTRVGARAPALAHARTTASHIMAAFHPLVVRPSIAGYATPAEVKGLVLYPKVVNKGAPRQYWRISEAVSMDGVMFHPEVEDVEMSEVLATNRKLPWATLINNPPLIS